MFKKITPKFSYTETGSMWFTAKLYVYNMLTNVRTVELHNFMQVIEVGTDKVEQQICLWSLLRILLSQQHNTATQLFFFHMTLVVPTASSNEDQTKVVPTFGEKYCISNLSTNHFFPGIAMPVGLMCGLCT